MTAQNATSLHVPLSAYLVQSKARSYALHIITMDMATAGGAADACAGAEFVSVSMSFSGSSPPRSHRFCIHLGRGINNYMRAHLSGGKITGPRDHPERHMEMEMAGWC